MVWGYPYAWFYISHVCYPDSTASNWRPKKPWKLAPPMSWFTMCSQPSSLDVSPFLPLLFWIVLAPQKRVLFWVRGIFMCDFSFRQLTTSNQSNQVPVATSLHLQNLRVNNWKNPRQKPQSSLPVANLVFGGQSATNCRGKMAIFASHESCQKMMWRRSQTGVFPLFFVLLVSKTETPSEYSLEVPGNAQWLHGKLWKDFRPWNVFLLQKVQTSYVLCPHFGFP